TTTPTPFSLRSTRMLHLVAFSSVMLQPPTTSTLFPYTTLFRSSPGGPDAADGLRSRSELRIWRQGYHGLLRVPQPIRSPDRERRSEEHTSELQSRGDLVCRLLLEKKKVSVCTQHSSGLDDCFLV